MTIGRHWASGSRARATQGCQSLQPDSVSPSRRSLFYSRRGQRQAPWPMTWNVPLAGAVASSECLITLEEDWQLNS